MKRPTESESFDDVGVKAYSLGTHRTISPAATLARVQPLLSRMGITRVANVTGLDRIGVPVVMVCRPNSRSIAVSQGKGLDLDAAKASGVMEAVESYHAERIRLPLLHGSFDDLRRGHPLADVDSLPRVADGKFRRDLQLLWIEGKNLIGGGPLWLPYEMVHTNYTLPLPTGTGCFVASTNGLASGNHPLEAIGHGICEVVERDATTVWGQLNKPARDQRRLDPATIDDESCRDVLDKIESAGFETAMWDTTTDVGIPSFYALIVDRRLEGAHSGAGAGTHPSRAVALLRALTEAVQVRTTYITGARDDLRPDEYTPPAIARKLRRARALIDGVGPSRDFSAIADHEADSFADDLAWMLDGLRAVGIDQVAAVDLTDPDFGIPVFRVVIPGLEGPDDHDRFVPGPRATTARQAVQ